MSNTTALRTAAILGGLAVALAAFGAHGLKAVLADNQTNGIWEKAVFYHFIHALALMVLAIWLRLGAPSYVAKLSWGLLLGIVLFSGSLYAYVLTAWKPLVFFTPIGGSVWLITWLVLALLSAKSLPVKHQVD